MEDDVLDISVPELSLATKVILYESLPLQFQFERSTDDSLCGLS